MLFSRKQKSICGFVFAIFLPVLSYSSATIASGTVEKIISVEIETGSPGSYSYLIARVIDQVDDLSEVEVIKAVNIDSTHDIYTQLHSNNSLLVNNRKIISRIEAKKKEDKVRRVSSAFNRAFSMLDSRDLVDVVGNPNFVASLQHARKVADKEELPSFVKLARLYEETLLSFPKGKDKRDPSSYPKWVKTVESNIPAFDEITEQFPTARFSVLTATDYTLKNVDRDDTFIRGVRSLVPAIYKLHMEAINRYPLNIDYYLTSKVTIDKALSMLDKLSNEDWVYDRVEYERHIKGVKQERDEFDREYQNSWVKKVRNEVTDAVDSKLIISQQAVEDIFTEVKSSVKSIEDKLQVTVIDDQFKSTLKMELLAYQNKLKTKEQERIRLANQHRIEAKKQILAEIEVDQLFTIAAADNAYKIIKSREAEFIQEGEKPLFPENQLEVLYQAVEDNQPRKSKFEIDTLNRLVESVEDKALSNVTTVKAALKQLEPELEKFHNKTGLSIDSSLVYEKLVQRASELELKRRKERIFVDNKEWTIKVYGWSYKKLKYFREKEFSGVFLVHSVKHNEKINAYEALGEFRSSLTPLNKQVPVNLVWNAKLVYGYRTDNFAFQIFNKGKSGHGRMGYAQGFNLGRPEFNPSGITVEGEFARDRSQYLKYFNKYQVKTGYKANSDLSEGLDDDTSKNALPSVKNSVLELDEEVKEEIELVKVLVAKSKKNKVEVYTVSESEEWCNSKVMVELKAESESFYKGNTSQSFMRKVGMVLSRQCSQLNEIDLKGTGNKGEAIYKALLNKESDWVPKVI